MSGDRSSTQGRENLYELFENLEDQSVYLTYHVSVFETRSPCVPQVGPKLMILLSQLPQCCDSKVYHHACLSSTYLFTLLFICASTNSCVFLLNFGPYSDVTIFAHLALGLPTGGFVTLSLCVNNTIVFSGVFPQSLQTLTLEFPKAGLIVARSLHVGCLGHTLGVVFI